MKYSQGFIESQLKKILPPSNMSVMEVSKESGVHQATIRRWIIKAKQGTLNNNNNVTSASRSQKEKLNLIQEYRDLLPEERGVWLRENGLHSEHITVYEQELFEMSESQKNSDKDKIKSLEKENKKLLSELKRKEKALAEMAALYTLKKKADAIWGEREDD